MFGIAYNAVAAVICMTCAVAFESQTAMFFAGTSTAFFLCALQERVREKRQYLSLNGGHESDDWSRNTDWYTLENDRPRP
ncbi:hypothetical protein [Brucella anthropi]|uniref:hypothetical protein n=1 Tax=Brucella anthropi TaxID=529 RepID=UPI000AAD5F2D|nr:hypothetical protein [Brucella anthropi]